MIACALLLAGCSVMVDADRVQCASNAECSARGPAFAGTLCVNQLCQPATDVCRGDDCPDEEPLDACVDDRCGAPDRRRDGGVDRRDAGATDARRTVRDSEPERERDAAEEPELDAGEPDAEPSPPEAAQVAECRQDADCTALGKVGARCVENVCFVTEPAAQCSADDQCKALGPEYEGGRCVASRCRPNPRFRCEPPPPPDVTAMLKVSILVRDSLSLNPLPNVQAKVCQKLDLTCAQPATTITTNSEGYFVFDLPRDFAGYLQFEDRRYMPALYFFPAVMPSDGKLQPAPLLGNGVVDGLALAIGSRISPQRGHLMLIAEDCMGTPLAGVSFQSSQDASTIQFYVRDKLPSTSAKETGEIGNGGYLNFPPGTAVISIGMAKTGLKLRTFSVVVRAGFITVAYVRPDPRAP